MMGRLPGVEPIRGKATFIKSMPATLKAMFPQGLHMKYHTVIAEGLTWRCSANRKRSQPTAKYANRYHFFIGF